MDGMVISGVIYRAPTVLITHVRSIFKFDPKFICVFVFVFLYLFICICVFLFVYLYLCICICIFVFVYLYLCICICICVFLCQTLGNVVFEVLIPFSFQKYIT